MICTPHRGSSLSCARLSCHTCMQWALILDFEFSMPSNFLFSLFIFNLLQSLLHFFHNLEGSSNTAYFAKKEMESYDESYLHTEVAKRTCATSHSVQILKQTNSVAENSLQGPRYMLMCEASAETQHRDDIDLDRQLQLKTEEEERVYAEQLTSKNESGHAQKVAAQNQIETRSTVESNNRIDRSSGEHSICRDGKFNNENERVDSSVSDSHAATRFSSKSCADWYWQTQTWVERLSGTS